ncbi:serine hydrolase domain-containing protein [Cerasicoccus maritimus]|uniref:serine hydrolase domain-containing protein n=1 Tax=Cerasicoccus maritimus TaxID=490089 RepID=UPI002852B1D9|nr:serine hydrolase domain-containing protein [Cerasicoccus maritimus]
MSDPKPVIPESLGLCSARLQRADAHIARFIADGKLVGAVTLVTRKDQLCHFNVQGYADREKQTPMSDTTLFRIYSMTKIITSVAAMIVYEEGLIDLNDPVSKYIPAFADQQVQLEDGSLVAANRPTTIYDLLRHTGGLPNDYNLEKLIESDRTLATFADELGARPLISQPGEKWIYGYQTDVLARIVEIVSEQPFANFLRDRIFDPLDMVDTGFDVPEEKRERLAVCYRYAKDGSLTPIMGNEADSLFVREKTFHSAAGGLVSSTRDYLRFATMLLRQGELDGVRILGRKTVELMTLDHLPEAHPDLQIGTQQFRFGLGVSVVTDVAKTRCLSSLGDFGWGGAAGTQVWMNPEEEMVVMIMIQVRAEVPTGVMDVYKRLVYQALIG